MPFYEHHVYKDIDMKIRVHFTKREKYSTFPMHWHKSPELWLVTDGTVELICDAIKYKYHAGELAIVNGNQLHEIGGENCSYYCMIIDHSICGKIGKLPQKSTNPEAISIYKAIVREFYNKELNYREAVVGYSAALLSVLSREAEIDLADNNSRKIEYVKKAADYIDEHFKEHITLDKISDEINISQSYLSHIFKEITGKTVIDYLIVTRCIHAKSLLKSGKYNVADAAYECGFSNLSYFSKTYKRIIGASPAKDIEKQKSADAFKNRSGVNYIL